MWERQCNCSNRKTDFDLGYISLIWTTVLISGVGITELLQNCKGKRVRRESLLRIINNSYKLDSASRAILAACSFAWAKSPDINSAWVILQQALISQLPQTKWPSVTRQMCWTLTQGYQSWTTLTGMYKIFWLLLNLGQGNSSYCLFCWLRLSLTSRGFTTVTYHGCAKHTWRVQKSSPFLSLPLCSCAFWYCFK